MADAEIIVIIVDDGDNDGSKVDSDKNFVVGQFYELLSCCSKEGLISEIAANLIQCHIHYQF